LSSYGWYDKLGVVKIPKSHIHQYREDSHRRVKSKGHAKRAILFCFLAVARILRLCQVLFFILSLHKILILAGTRQGCMNSAAAQARPSLPLTEPVQNKGCCLRVKMISSKLHISLDPHNPSRD